MAVPSQAPSAPFHLLLYDVTTLEKIVETMVLPTRSGTELRCGCITRPTDHQVILLQHLGLNLPKNIKMNPM